MLLKLTWELGRVRVSWDVEFGPRGSLEWPLDGGTTVAFVQLMGSTEANDNGSQYTPFS